MDTVELVLNALDKFCLRECDRGHMIESDRYYSREDIEKWLAEQGYPIILTEEEWEDFKAFKGVKSVTTCTFYDCIRGSKSSCYDCVIFYRLRDKMSGEEILRKYRDKNGFCPDCGDNLGNGIVKFQHETGRCRGLSQASMG